MKVLLPNTVEQLWQLLEDEHEAAVYAGGTDLLVKHRAGLIQPGVLICLERIEELTGVEERDGEVVIGASTTHTALHENSIIGKYCGVLRKAIRVLGSPPIRNMATIGGNICTASPAGDTLPPLYLLDAEVETWSKQGMRRLPIERFILGPGKTALEKGEIVSRVRIRKADDYRIHHFEKVGQRKAMSISIASLAAIIKMNETGTVEKIGLAWGSVGPTVVRSEKIDKMLTGACLGAPALETIGPLVKQSVSPIDDLRASADYRRTVSANLVLRLSHYGHA